jgi:hypothetical protein
VTGEGTRLSHALIIRSRYKVAMYFAGMMDNFLVCSPQVPECEVNEIRVEIEILSLFNAGKFVPVFLTPD